MKKSVRYLIFLIAFILPFSITAQEEEIQEVKIKTHQETSIDTTTSKKHSPHKATIYSMILPGLGQAYNKKYWKIPIVYAGFGVMYYFISFNDTEYKKWREAYYHALQYPDGSDPPVNDYEEKYGYDTDILKDQKNYYRRNRDLTYILSGIWYLLNIVDATVDAHLFSWEVDDNLSLRVEPTMYEPILGYKQSGGLKLTLRF